MATAMKGGAGFSSMLEATHLSKTALANHLTQLIERGLVGRQSRGRYVLTRDGKELLAAAFSTYRTSSRRSQREMELVKRSYSEAYGEGRRMERKEVSMDVAYQPCWLSFNGAIAGCLTALGMKRSTADVGGSSGYSFLVNVSKGETCPSGPTAIHPKAFKTMIAGVEELGWGIDAYEYPHSYPSKKGVPTPEELRTVWNLFQRIKKEIDEKDRPVVLWGLAAPEYGIVKGYDGDTYIVRTFRSIVDPGEEEPVRYQDLKAPGCIDAFFFTTRLKVSPSRARKNALRRALDFADARIPVQRNYVAGPAALIEWASVLKELPEDRQNYMGNSYVGCCVGEGRALSSMFLRSVVKKMPARPAEILDSAAASYARGAKLMGEFEKLFPFRFEGKMPARKRRAGAALLLKVSQHEERAIQKMTKVV